MAKAHFSFEDKICIEMEAQMIRYLLGQKALEILAAFALASGQGLEDGPIRFNLMFTTDKLVVEDLKAGPVTVGSMVFRLDGEDIVCTEPRDGMEDRVQRFYPTDGGMYLAYEVPEYDIPDMLFARVLVAWNRVT